MSNLFDFWVNGHRTSNWVPKEIVSLSYVAWIAFSWHMPRGPELNCCNAYNLHCCDCLYMVNFKLF